MIIESGFSDIGWFAVGFFFHERQLCGAGARVFNGHRMGCKRGKAGVGAEIC